MSLRLSWKTLLATLCCVAIAPGCAPWKPWANQKATPAAHAPPREAIRQNHDDLDKLLAAEHAPPSADSQKSTTGSFASLNVFGQNNAKQSAAKHVEIEQDLALARLGERRGQSDGAKQMYLKIMEKHPDHPVAFHRLGVIYAKENNFAEANQYLEHAVGMGTPTIEMLNDLGYCYYLQSRYDDAEKVLRTALKQKPNHESTCNNLGLVLGAQGRYAEAFEAFSRVNTEAESHANLAYVFSQQGDLGNARQGYLEALSRDRNLREAALAVIQVDQKIKQQAQERERVAKNQQHAPPSLPPGYNLPPGPQQQHQHAPPPPAVAQRPAPQAETMPEQRFPSQRSAEQALPPQMQQPSPPPEAHVQRPAPAIETMPEQRLAPPPQTVYQPAPQAPIHNEREPVRPPQESFVRSEPAPVAAREFERAPDRSEAPPQRPTPSPAPRMAQSPPPPASKPQVETARTLPAAPRAESPRAESPRSSAYQERENVVLTPPRATQPIIVPPMQAESEQPPLNNLPPRESLTSREPVQERPQPQLRPSTPAPQPEATESPRLTEAAPPRSSERSPAVFSLPRIPLVQSKPAVQKPVTPSPSLQKPSEHNSVPIVAKVESPRPTVVEPVRESGLATQGQLTPSPRSLSPEPSIAPRELMPVAPQTTVAEVEPKPSTDWKGQRQAPSEVHNQFVTPSVQPEPVKLVKPVPLQLESVAKPERTLAANSQSPRATTSPLSVANTPPRKIEDRNTFQPAPMRQKIVAQSPSQPREDLNGSRPVLPEDRDSFQPAPMQREMLEPTPAETVATSRPPQDFSRKLTFDPSLAKEGPAHQPPQLEEHVKERQPEYRPAPSRETVAATRPVEVVPGQSTRKPTAAGRSQLASLGKAITTGNLVTNRRSDASPTTPLSQGQPKPAATLVAARPAEIRQHNALPPIVSADSYQQDRSAQSQNASSLDATTIKAQPANATPSASGGIGLRGFVRTSEASSLPPIVSAQDHDNLKRGQ